MQRIIFSLLLAGLSTGAVFAKGKDIDKVNGSIHTEAGVSYGDLESVNGSIELEENAIAEGVSTVNGSIRIRDGAQAESIETVNGGLKLGRGVVIRDGLETVNGRIEIGGGSRIGEGIESVNGSIDVDNAEVGGGIETVNADLTLDNGTLVRGGIHYEEPGGSWFNFGKKKTPKVVIGANVVVEGDLKFDHDVELFVHDSAKVGRISGASAKRYSGSTP
ncbi:MAG: hypothetical protein R3F01_01705 [Lysobacteraceae bacterium]